MPGDISVERMQRMIKVIPEFYSVESVLLANGLLRGAEDKGNDFLLSCPFHSDSTPSFRIVKRSGVYHCFSCERSGSLLKLMHALSVSKMSFYSFADNLLKQDLKMQAALGFNTIFDEVVRHRSRPLEPRKPFVVDRGADIPLSVLSSYLQDTFGDYDCLVTSLTMLQAGISAYEIKHFYDTLGKARELGSRDGKVSLMDILTEK